MQQAGHEVLSTDFGQSTVDALRARIDHPVFACDLAHLDSVLPEAVDVVIGNSTLAYIDPKKLGRVVQNVAGAMRVGGVFTFDLAPHPSYFIIANGKTKRQIANESGADPAKLLEFIRRYGRQDGINAMAVFTYYQTLSVNMAMVQTLRELFERSGLRAIGGMLHLQNEHGGHETCLTLRVSREPSSLLDRVAGEQDLPSWPIAEEPAAIQAAFRLELVDRASGEELARALGIHEDRRQDPWLVAAYVMQNQRARDLPSALREEILNEIAPSIYATRIKPYVDGTQVFVPPPPLPFLLQQDQVIHKMVITGVGGLDMDLADLRIDQLYAEAAARSKLAAERARHAKEKEKNKKDRKRQKQDRKKQRRK
jgi:hypothetical protein